MGPAPARPPGAGALAPDPDLAYHQDNEAYRVEDAYPDPGSSHGVPKLCSLFFSFSFSSASAILRRRSGCLHAHPCIHTKIVGL